MSCRPHRGLIRLGGYFVMLDPSMPLAEPPFEGEQGREDQEERPVVPDLVFGRA